MIAQSSQSSAAVSRERQIPPEGSTEQGFICGVPNQSAEEPISEY